ADEEASLLAAPDEGHELVAGHPAPGREIFFHGDRGGTKFEELAALHRIHVLTDQKKEPVAAIQIAAVEARIGVELVSVNGLHRSGSSLRVGEPRNRSVADAGTALGQELDELRTADDRGAGHQVVLVELALLEARRADVDRAAGLGEVVHQLAERGEAFLADVV